MTEVSVPAVSMDALLSPTINSSEDESQDEAYPLPQNSLHRTPSRTSSIGIFGSPSNLDTSMLSNENKILKRRLKEVQQDAASEQDTINTLRKRINSMDRERLDAISKANEDIGKLNREVTKLRAQVEKGEAVRQNLEYELAKSRQENSMEKRGSSERENLLTEVNESMKNKMEELSLQLDTLCVEMESERLTSQDESTRLRIELEEKEKQLSNERTRIDILEAEKEKQEAMIGQHESAVNDFQDRIKDLEEEKRQLNENMRRQVTETDILREREDRLKNDLENAYIRVKTLEESIEAERAAHLESKFNSEIVQLRMRDLEGALDLEKTSKTEAASSSDKLNRQIKELQKAYEEERREAQLIRERQESAEREYGSVSQQLQTEVQEKTQLIKKLSTQLELHQKNFNELKEELSKAKKRQIYLEETYGGSMRELELLLENFDLTSTTKRKPQRKKDSSRTPSPSDVLDNVRLVLNDCKTTLDVTKAELTRLRDEESKLSKECESYKNMIWAKDKALEDAQNHVTRTSKELQKKHSHQSGLENTMEQLQQDLQMTRSSLEREKTEKTELNQQIVRLADRYKMDEHTKLQFLHNLYQQLLTGRFLTQPPDGPLSGFGWNDLSMLVGEQVSVMLHTLQRLDEKVKQLEDNIAKRDKGMNELQKAHEEQLNKIFESTEFRDKTWQQQKAELEQHYSQLLSEIHTRQKKSQAMADQAWEKARVTGSLQQGLEKECTHLRQQVVKFQNEQSSLLAACALLCGALYPLYTKNAALGAQCHLLSEQVEKFDMLKSQVSHIVEALNIEHKKDSPSKPIHLRSPLLRFRKVTIAVMAANRLANIVQGTSKMFVAHDAVPGVFMTSVYTGGVEPLERKFRGLEKSWFLGGGNIKKAGAQDAANWLTSQDLLSSVVSSMTDLQIAMKKSQELEPGMDSAVLMNTARNSFQKLMLHLPSSFSTLVTDPHSGFKERNSLIRFLGHGLHRAMAQSSLGGKPYYVSAQIAANNLQQQMLEFTQRLHNAEVERRDMRNELTHLKHEKEGWSRKNGAVEGLQHEIDSLLQKVVKADDMVSRERFERVCKELEGALKREQQATMLLNQQGHQLEDVTHRLDQQLNKGSEKEHNVSTALQNLHEARMELRRQEQQARQLNRQVGQLENEKKSLKENIKDAENALKTAARDKEALGNYMQNVEQNLEQIKTAAALTSGRGGDAIDFSSLLNFDAIPQTVRKIGPELSACQLLVSSFVDCYTQLSSKILMLQDEILAHKRHITTLKRELNAACQREFDVAEHYIEDFPSSRNGHKSSSRSTIGRGSPKLDKNNSSSMFSPLEEDIEASYGAPSSASKSLSRSSLKGTSPLFKTPVAASRNITTKRRQQEMTKGNR